MLLLLLAFTLGNVCILVLLLLAFLVPYAQIQTVKTIFSPWPTFETTETTGTAIHRFAAGFKAVYVYY